MEREQTATADLQHGLNLTGVPDPGTIVEYAVRAEEAEWDGVFHIDHLVDFTASEPGDHHSINDSWITWAGVASRTDRITLGSYVTPIPRRHPWQLARNLATLDRLSEGRVMLGAGLGTPWDFEAFGIDYDQKRLATKYDEALDVITGLWSGEPFSYDGEHFTVNEAVMRPTPVQEPRIPIVVGGWWPFKKPFHRGARWDGIIPNWPSMHYQAPYLDDMPEHMQAVVPDEPAHEEEVREMVGYYRDIADDPGEIMLSTASATAPEGFTETCRDVGATWVIHSPVDSSLDRAANITRIREGPPD